MTNAINDNWHPLFEGLNIGIALVSKEGNFLKVNPFLCDLIGYNDYEILKKSFQEITHPSDLEADEDMSKKVILGEIPGYRMIKRYITKTNKIVWVEIVVLCIKKEDIFQMFFVQILPINISNDFENSAPPQTINLFKLFKNHLGIFFSFITFVIATIIGLGIAFWTGINQVGLLSAQVESLSKDVSGNRRTIMKIVDDEITKQRKILEEIKQDSKEKKDELE